MPTSISCTLTTHEPQILQQYAKNKEFLKLLLSLAAEGNRHWYFEDKEGVLELSQLPESVVIGDSIDGDKLVFHPAHLSKIYIVSPYNITFVKADFSDLHRWDTLNPRLLTFAPWYGQTTLNFLTQQFRLNQIGCLQQIKKWWGSDKVLVAYESSDDWSWALVVFVLPIGGRVQVTQDKHVTRTYQDVNGITVTKQGNGQRSLAIRIDCDKEAVAEVGAFVAQLEVNGFCSWKH